MAVARGAADKVIEMMMRIAKDAKSGMHETLNTTGRKNPPQMIPTDPPKDSLCQKQTTEISRGLLPQSPSQDSSPPDCERETAEGRKPTN